MIPTLGNRIRHTNKYEALSFKDVHINACHIETMNEGNKKCLYITFIVYGKKLIVEII